MSNNQRKSVNFVNKENQGASNSTNKHNKEAATVAATTSSGLDKPRLNKLTELRKQLNEIKNYEAKVLTSTNDLSANTQQIVNRAVSNKLNFPFRGSVYKDLPKIDDTNTADKLIQRVVKKTKDTNRKSNEVRDEIKDLINKLVEMEYQNEQMNRKAQFCPLPNEEEYLGFNKFNGLNFALPNKKTESERFHKKLHNQINHSVFGCEDYLSYNRQRDFEAPPRVKKGEKDCKCINAADFYKRHSKCS